MICLAATALVWGCQPKQENQNDKAGEAATAAANDEKDHEAHAKKAEETPARLTGYFGEEIKIENTVTATALPGQMEKADSMFVTVTGTIVETCPKMGCWMTIEMEDGQQMRVTFKDYAFFVPKDGVGGYKATFQGLAKKTMTPVETLKHYAEDAGKSAEEVAAITEPAAEIAFEAVGVFIEEATK